MEMRPVVADVAVTWSLCVCVCVCLCLCLCVGPTDFDILYKTAEPIEMPFGG